MLGAPIEVKWQAVLWYEMVDSDWYSEVSCSLYLPYYHPNSRSKYIGEVTFHEGEVMVVQTYLHLTNLDPEVWNEGN